MLVLCSAALIAVLYAGLGRVTKHGLTGVAQEAFLVREKAGRTDSSCTTVYLGDSVCRQLWDPEDEDVNGICHLGCTQAITPVGSYLLLREYLGNNPQTEAVYFFVRPQTLANDIWLDFSYQYFVIPFLDEANLEYVEAETKERIYDKFSPLFVNSAYFKTTLLNNNLLMQTYLNSLHEEKEVRDYYRISNTAGIYLKKMADLCDEKGVKLIVRSTPMPEWEKNSDWTAYQNDIKLFGFEELLEDYFKNIVYYPSDWFSDGVHFTDEILEQYGDEIRNSVFQEANSKT